MASVINTNMASLYAQKNLSGAQNALGTAVERLSSGLRINRAKDDAAGLGISQKLTSQIKALGQGIRNANDATSMVQTAEGAMSEVNNILQRMKELSVQARNESLSSTERSYIADELIQLRDEINAIGERTSYNGMSLLKNSLRAQVSSTLSSGSLSDGASLMSGLSVQALKVESANTGSYSLSVRNVVAEAGFTQASNVNQNPVPTAVGANTARTVTVAQGDVYEGAILSVTVPGASGSITYSAVAGQDDTAATIATKLTNSLARDFSGSVSASSNVITFADDAALGNSDIVVSAGYMQEGQAVASVRSTVDSPFVESASARTISLNDFDIQEGRKLTVRIGNPNAFTEFSTYVGSGATKESVAQDLTDLISQVYTDVSRSGNDITFAASANMGQAAMSLTIKETTQVASDLTVSAVSNKYGVATARSLEIVDADVDPGRVFSLSVDGKDYSYKVQTNDTASTVAYALADLLAEDYGSVAGLVSASDVSVNGTQGATTVAASAATASVTFRDIKAGEAYNVGNLSFTANRDVSASELADAFAGVSAGGAGNSVAYGSFSGSLTDASSNAFSSGAKVQSGDSYSVTFTSATAGAAVASSALADSVSITNQAASTVEISAVTSNGSTSVGANAHVLGDTESNGTAGAVSSFTTTSNAFTFLRTGDAVIVSGVANNGAGTVADGVAYIRYSAGTYSLHASAANAVSNTSALTLAAGGSFTVGFKSAVQSNTIDAGRAHGFQTGDRVQYTATGTAITGLTKNADYFVIATTGNTFQLASSLENALAGTALTLDGTAMTVGDNQFALKASVGTATKADENTTVSLSRAGGLAGDEIEIDGVKLTLTGSASGAEIAEAFKNYFKDGLGTNFGDFSGTLSGRFTVAMSTNPVAPISTVGLTTTVNESTGVFTSGAHSLTTGMKVLYTEGAVPVQGLEDGREYYVTTLSATTYTLSATLEEALSPTKAITGIDSADEVDVANDAIIASNHGLATGDMVTYTVAATSTNGAPVAAIGGLTTTAQYFVISAEDGNSFKLATTKANALSGVSIDITSAGVGSDHRFDRSANAIVGGKNIDLLAHTTATGDAAALVSSVDVDAGGVNVLTDTLSDASYPHGFLTGDQITYAAGAGNAAIGGLTNSGVYYAIRVSDTEFQLAATLADARAGNAVDLTGASGDGTQTFTRTAVGASAGSVKLAVVSDQTTVFDATTAGGINGASNTLLSAALTNIKDGLSTGDMVRYTVAPGGTAIGGLTSGEDYYAIVDTGGIRLAATYEDTQVAANATGSLTLTEAGGLVDLTNNSFNVVGHGFQNGDRVVYSNGGSTSVGGLASAQSYYVVKVDDDNFALATTRERALQGSAVDLTAYGVGTAHTFTRSAGREIDLTGTSTTASVAGSGQHAFQRISNEIVLTATVDNDDRNLVDVQVSTSRSAATSTSVQAGDVVSTAGVDASAGSNESYAMTFASGMQMSAGDSLTIGGLRFTASATLNRDQIVAAFANLSDGSTYGQGLEYGSYDGKLRGYASGSASSGALTFTASSAGTNVDDLVVSAEATKANITVSGDDSNVINFATTAKLGTADIGISVNRYSDAGVLTMTANDDTGIGGTSQSVDLGTIASGGSKFVNFDKLGVSFNLVNSSGAAIGSEDFEVNGSQLSSLTLDSAADGAAMFQVGAGTRDTVNIDGFKDIRIGDFNKNADNTVFTEIAETLSDIEGGDLDPVTTFATLENQIDAMIGEVSGFRSYLGAQQNRLDHTIAAVQAQSDNITAANSRILDTDYAAETANLTKTQIMQQAATAMLAQANQMPNVILALLK